MSFAKKSYRCRSTTETRSQRWSYGSRRWTSGSGGKRVKEAIDLATGDYAPARKAARESLDAGLGGGVAGGVEKAGRGDGGEGRKMVEHTENTTRTGM